MQPFKFLHRLGQEALEEDPDEAAMKEAEQGASRNYADLSAKRRADQPTPEELQAIGDNVENPKDPTNPEIDRTKLSDEELRKLILQHMR